MKLAVIGSRSLTEIHIDKYIPDGVSEIVSGGAKGIDTLAKDYANRHGLRFTEVLPKHNLYGRAAPIKRNREIAKYADRAVALWDGISKGTAHTINFFKESGKTVSVYIINEKNEN